MLPLLHISTLPAFTLLLVAPASYRPNWKLVRELGLAALLLARELLRHSTSAAAGKKEQCIRKMPPSKATGARKQAPPALAVDADDSLPLLDHPELVPDRVLEELSPASLAAMVCVYAGFRDRCSMDHPPAHEQMEELGQSPGDCSVLSPD